MVQNSVRTRFLWPQRAWAAGLSFSTFPDCTRRSLQCNAVKGEGEHFSVDVWNRGTGLYKQYRRSWHSCGVGWNWLLLDGEMLFTKRGLFLGCDWGGDLSTRPGLQFTESGTCKTYYYVTRKWNKLERHDDTTICKAGDTGVEDTQQTLGQQTETASSTSPPISRNHHQFCPGEDLSIINIIFKGFYWIGQELEFVCLCASMKWIEKRIPMYIWMCEICNPIIQDCTSLHLQWVLVWGLEENYTEESAHCVPV